MRLTRTLLTAAALGMLVAAILPSATAQVWSQPVVDVRAHEDPHLPNGRLMPNVGVAVLRIQAQVTLPPASVCPYPLQVRFAIIEMPAYATGVLSPATQNLAFAAAVLPGPETQTAETILRVWTNDEAPAFEDGHYRVRATLDPPNGPGAGCTVAAAQSEASVVVQNDYVAKVAVEAPTLEAETIRGEFAVTFHNLGNGPTRVVSLLSALRGSFEHLNPGSEVRLESKVSKGAAAHASDSRHFRYVALGAGIHVIHADIWAGYDGTAPGDVLEDRQTLVFTVFAGDGPTGEPFGEASALGALGLASALGVAVGFGRRRFRG